MLLLDILKLLELLRIQSNQILSYKVRIGAENDGGFILIDNLKHITKLYSLYDVFPHTFPFENEFVKYTHATAHFYNHKFIPQCLEENNDLQNSQMILKINQQDISFLVNLSEGILNKFEQIVLTLYSVTSDVLSKIQIISKLNSLFHLVHIHGNNNFPLTTNLPYFKIPDTFEITFIRKNSYTLYNDTSVPIPLHFFPTNFDSPNNSMKPDHSLSFYPFKDYYFSLSTIPSRMHNIKNVIESLLNQVIKPKKIFIHIPRVYRRFPLVEIVLPNLSEYPAVEIVRCSD